VNNETFIISLRLYYKIYYYILLYAVYILYLVKDRNTQRNINMHKCLHLQSRYAAVTSLNFVVWCPGMSKLLKSHAVGLPLTKNQQERKYDETCRVCICICKESKRLEKAVIRKVATSRKARLTIDNEKHDTFQFVSIWLWSSRCLFISISLNKYEIWSFTLKFL